MGRGGGIRGEVLSRGMGARGALTAYPWEAGAYSQFAG
jgi:hypothetical protein